MQTVTDRYLDAVKARLDITSDGQLAEKWGVTRQRISNYRQGLTALSDERCLQVAEILGIAPETVLFEVQAERARKAGNVRLSEVFESILKRLSHSPAAYVFLAMTFGLFFAEFSALPDFQNLSIAALGIVRPYLTDNINYAKYTIILALPLLALAIALFRKTHHDSAIRCHSFYYNRSLF